MFFSTIYGTEVKGIVTDKHSHVDSEDGRIYNIEIEYKFNDENCDEKLTISKQEYKQYEVGSSVDVRFLPALRGITQSVKPAGEGAYKSIDLATVGFYIFFAVFWNALLSVFVLILYVAPVVNWWLLRYGAVCPGRIQHKSSHSDSDSTTYKIDYVYAPGKKSPTTFEQGVQFSSGTPGKTQVTSSTSVAHSVWLRQKEGQDICVLYSPRWPSIHCVYEFSDCEIRA